jgi:putative transposase
MVDSRSSEKTIGVGGEQRVYDGSKKARGRKRHLLVDNEGFVLGAEVLSAKVMDRDGIEMLLRQSDTPFARLEHLWVGAVCGEKIGARTVRRRSSDAA